MATKPYQDRALLYELYVKRRMTMTDIQKYFEKKYDVKVTGQTVYNYLKRFDLLKFRGKGRKMMANQMKPKLSPTAIAAQKHVREQRKKMKQRLGSKPRF